MKKYIVSLAIVLTASLFASKANAATKEQSIKIEPLTVTNSNVAPQDGPIQTVAAADAIGAMAGAPMGVAASAFAAAYFDVE